MKNTQKAKLLYESNFNIYGIGHFDLNQQDYLELLNILDGKQVKKELNKLYERLERKRLG